MQSLMTVSSDLGKFNLANTLTGAAASLLASRVEGAITDDDIEEAIYDAVRIMRLSNDAITVKK